MRDWIWMWALIGLCACGESTKVAGGGGATPDGATPDGATPDGATPDGATPDGATPDGATPDAGPRAWQVERILGEEDGLNGPDGLFTVGPGLVWLANEVGGQVLEINVDERTTRVLADHSMGLSHPEEVALGPAGDLWVTDDSARVVFRIRDGVAERVLTAADGLQSPEGFVVEPDGTLVISDERAHFIMRLPAGGGEPVVIADEADGIYAPEGLAQAPWGTIYITDDIRGGVLRLEPDGEVAVFVGPEGLGLPEAVGVSPEGDLWFTDNGGTATAQRWSREGVWRETIDLPIPRGTAAGLAVLPDGRLVVSAFQANRRHELWLLTPEGGG